MISMKYLLRLIGLFALALVALNAHADKPSDAAALHGVTTGKVVWDINMGDPKKMVLYLKVIRETYDDLVRQDVMPDMVFAFRGKSVLLINQDREQVPLEEHDALDQIASLLADLQKRPGVIMEACSVATGLFGVKNENLLPWIKPVGNTFVSLIGYQAQGYGTIAIY